MCVKYATTETMKLAAPINSPIAKLPASLLSAEKVEKTSGDPFEKAKNVTPAYTSHTLISWRGQKRCN